MHYTHLVSQFQNITSVVNRKAAEYVMKGNQWRLNRAIDWFYEHRNDGNVPSEIRRALKTEEELKQGEAGKMIKD